METRTMKPLYCATILALVTAVPQASAQETRDPAITSYMQLLSEANDRVAGAARQLQAETAKNQALAKEIQALKTEIEKLKAAPRPE